MQNQQHHHRRRQPPVNPLTQFCKQQELGALHEDMCYIDRRDADSKKPFALRTWYHRPYGSKVQSTCYPGQFYWDGHVGGANVDEESKVNRYPGYEMTNPNVHQELPMLPVQLPRIRGYFDSDTESSLRSEATFNNKQCTGTSEKSFIPQTFQDFSNLCYDPQDSKYIIPEDTMNKCYPNARFWHRAGSDTRHDRQERYRNAANYGAKYFPSTLSFSNFGY